jgi:hypothetical protein
MTLPLRVSSFGAMTGAVLLGALGVVGCESTTPPQEAAAPPAAVEAPAPPMVKPTLSFNAMMVSWIDNAGHVLWDVEKEGFAPKDDADWLEVEDHGIQLAAAATLLQLGGTGQADDGWVKQVGWASNAQAMGAAGMAASAAAKAKDKAALVKANSDLVAACEGCHKQFKPNLPTEGLSHQRAHSESHKDNR